MKYGRHSMNLFSYAFGVVAMVLAALVIAFGITCLVFGWWAAGAVYLIVGLLFASAGFKDTRDIHRYRKMGYTKND